MEKTLADIIILWLLKLGITMLINNKDDIEFVTEFPCFLGHPVYNPNPLIPAFPRGLLSRREKGTVSSLHYLLHRLVHIECLLY